MPLEALDKQFAAKLASDFERDLSCWTEVEEYITDYAEQYNLAFERETKLRDYAYSLFI